ncbi:beta-lactamase family protein [Undibacterium sp. LX15W]|uniref:Beta-lactamase family protein n=2 Tax=Undibacterium flavidum TaxID=2762297 RepID=A0ABR6Y774_9BURK|nr:beta-lactamase family protein [Undibacterium flavidum]
MALSDQALQDRIKRVENGLTTLVVVKGVSDRKMTLADRMKFYQVPAVSIALVNNGKIEWARAYGTTTADGKQAITPTTLFQAASISKAVSAIGALHLVEQGKLKLDGDVNQQLISWKVPENEFTKDKKVSLRHLLNHSAGINVHGFRGYETSQKIPNLLAVLDGKAPANSDPVRVESIPGTGWRYSGGGYSIIQLLMTEASKQSFPQLMQKTVFAPLKMTHSIFTDTLSLAMSKNAVGAHRGDGKAIQGQWHHYPELAAAGLWTTPSDLANIIIEVQRAEAGKSGKVLSNQMTTAMLTRILGETGLGFYVEKLADRTSFSHSGGSEGFRAQLYGYTKTGQGAVIMTNSDNGAALNEEILASIAAEYDWPEFKVTEKVMIAPDLAMNQQFAGKYTLLDRPAHVIAEGDRLYFQSDLISAKRVEIYRESGSRFFVTAPDMTINFERDAQGNAAGFSLLKGSSTYPATRVK